MMAGPIATAASVEGATELTLSPMAEDVNDSRVMSPQNLAKRPRVGWRPLMGYTTAPKASGKNAPAAEGAHTS